MAPLKGETQLRQVTTEGSHTPSPTDSIITEIVGIPYEMSHNSSDSKRTPRMPHKGFLG